MSKQYPGGFIMANPTAPTSSAAPGIWTLDQAQQYIKAGTWPGGPDPYFPYTTLLLPGNGTNGAQNNTFLDSSTNNFTITRNGNTTQGTFTPYGANWSNYFDGTGDYLSTPNNSAIHVFGSDFCLEGWFFLSAAQGNYGLYSTYATSGGATANGYIVRLDSTIIRFFYGQGASSVSVDRTYAFSQGQWYHFAVTSSSGTGRIFINGVLQGATFTISSPTNSSETLQIGRTHTVTNDFPGYFSNFRIVKGSAVYTSDFTPPTAPLTAITNTSLLTCQSNRFIDNSTNNFTITRNGDVSVQVFSPFSPTASYDAATIGGSGYFSGSADYLDSQTSSAFAIGTTGTYECWAYATSWGGNRRLISQSNNGASSFEIYVQADGTISISSGSNSTAAGAFPLGQWVHVAAVYNSGTLSLYVNGTSISLSGTTTGRNITDTQPILVSALRQTGSILTGFNWVGYISSVRILKGTALYTANFTPPTAPPTAITNTSLLLNFTNAGVIDNAMMNDLQTVADAQISTTQSKWGGSSIYLDGTGDYLQLQPSSQNFNFGASGDYTIEAWIYQTNRKTDLVPIFQTAGTNATGYVFGIDASTGGLAIYDGGSYRITATASTVSLNTWTHVAATRSGGTTRVFIDGVQAGSATYTYSSTSYADPRIGINASYTPAIFQGYIDDFRITKGYARYTANFTPPAGPFPTR